MVSGISTFSLSVPNIISVMVTSSVSRLYLTWDAVFGILADSTVNPLGRKMLARLVQLSKAPTPMEVTLSGIVTFAKLVQPIKTPSSMEVTLSGIVTLFSPVQPSKARYPIVCTPLSIVTLARLLQF